jgi:hypothetical protein
LWKAANSGRYGRIGRKERALSEGTGGVYDMRVRGKRRLDRSSGRRQTLSMRGRPSAVRLTTYLGPDARQPPPRARRTA